MDPDESAGFEQTLARLTQSERSLSQTRAKLVNAETQAEQLQAKVASLTDELRELRELSQSLSRDSAAGTDECAKLAESLRAAETRLAEAEARSLASEARAAAAEARAAELETRLAEAEARERDALIAAEDARDEQAAARAELEQLARERSDVAPWSRDSGSDNELARKLAASEARLDTLTHERTRLLELMSSLEVLGREITTLTQQATTDVPGLPKVEEWLGRDVEAEHVRATLRPEAFSAPPPQARRAWSTPEIMIDGIKLES
jgi:chromosome segregation ATPase